MRTERSIAPHAGIVIALSGDEATLRFSRGRMCAHCGACLSAGPQEMEMTLPNTLGAKLGDRVSVSLTGTQIAGASLIAYAIPLALLLLGILIGSRISDLAALLCGLGGCAVSFAVLRMLDRRIKQRRAFQPSMQAILPAVPSEEPETPEEN